MALSKDAAADLRTWLAERKRAALYHNYMEGRHNMAWATEKFKRKWKWALAASTTNYCPAVVNAVANGIKITGFEGAVDAELEANLKRESRRVTKESVAAGNSFVVVWHNPRTGKSQATYQAAGTVVPTVDFEDQAVLARASRVWLHADGYYHLQVFYPDRMEWFVSDKRFKSEQELEKNVAAWSPFKAPATATHPANETGIYPHSYEAVPVGWFKAEAASGYAPGTSLLRDIIPIQDRLNLLVADQIVASRGAAAPILYMLGVDREDTEWSVDPTNDEASPPSVEFDENKDSILLSSAQSAGQFAGPNTQALIALHEKAKDDMAGVLGLTSWTLNAIQPTNIALETVQVLSRPVVERQEAWVADNRPVWRGMLELLGVEASPIFSVDEVTPPAGVEPVVGMPGSAG